MFNQNKELMREMVNSNQHMISQLMTNSKPAMVDTRWIGKPGTFKGDESKFLEWVTKLNAYIRASYPTAPNFLKEVCIKGERVTEATILEMCAGHAE